MLADSPIANKGCKCDQTEITEEHYNYYINNSWNKTEKGAHCVADKYSGNEVLWKAI